MKKDHSPDDSSLTEDDEKSKSQVKREMHELLALGAELVKLPNEQLAKIELSETLYDAVIEGKRITQHGAHKRHLQFIGKIMRNVDAEYIREQIDTLEGHSKQAAAALHHIERWRDDLLAEGDGALERLLTEFPSADRQYLRQLVRNAKKEMQGNKPPKSARALFKCLRDLMTTDSEE